MEHRLTRALRRLPPATLVGGQHDGAHVVLRQETGCIRRHVLDRAADRASCAGVWDGLDEPLATVLRERCPPASFGGGQAGGFIARPTGNGRKTAAGTLVRLEVPRSAHARLADGGRRAAPATDPRLRALLWGGLPTDATPLLRRGDDRPAWAVEDRILGCAPGGTSALPAPSPIRRPPDGGRGQWVRP
jgi:hypothetical protein